MKGAAHQPFGHIVIYCNVFLLRLNKTALFPQEVPLCVLPLDWSPGPC